MAIEGLSAVPAHERAEVSGDTDQLRALLVGYASIVEKIDNAPPVLWASVERPRILRWLRVPAIRALVSALLVRHVSRCISALKRGGARRVALADDALGPQRDLEMLEKFEQSLPRGVRMAVITPLALIGLLFGAFIVSKVVIHHSTDTKLLGDLASAALTLERQKALDAIEKDGADNVAWGAAINTIAWLAALIIAPLLPAFSVKRRLLRPLTDLESRGFAALGCRRVQDLEFDLVAQLLVITPVAVAGALFLWFGAFGVPSNSTWADVSNVPHGFLKGFGATWVCLAALAGVYLCGRYAERRVDAMRRHTLITRVVLWIPRVALLLAWACSGIFLIVLVREG
jgi:hypothetical protein